MTIFRELKDFEKKAMSFLRRELSDGEKHSAAELRQKAKGENVSYRSLLKAKQILKVSVSNDSYFQSWSLNK